MERTGRRKAPTRALWPTWHGCSPKREMALASASNVRAYLRPSDGAGRHGPSQAIPGTLDVVEMTDLPEGIAPREAGPDESVRLHVVWTHEGHGNWRGARFGTGLLWWFWCWCGSSMTETRRHGYRNIRLPAVWPGLRFKSPDPAGRDRAKESARESDQARKGFTVALVSGGKECPVG